MNDSSENPWERVASSVKGSITRLLIEACALEATRSQGLFSDEIVKAVPGCQSVELLFEYEFQPSCRDDRKIEPRSRLYGRRHFYRIRRPRLPQPKRHLGEQPHHRIPGIHFKPRGPHRILAAESRYVARNARRSAECGPPGLRRTRAQGNIARDDHAKH